MKSSESGEEIFMSTLEEAKYDSGEIKLRDPNFKDGKQADSTSDDFET